MGGALPGQEGRRKPGSIPPPPSIASLSPLMVWCEHLGPPAPCFSGGVGVRGGHSPPQPKIWGGWGGDDTASARRIGARCESRPFWAGTAANSSFFCCFFSFFLFFSLFFLFFLFFFSPLQLTKLHQLAMQQSHFPMSHGNTGFSGMGTPPSPPHAHARAENQTWELGSPLAGPPGLSNRQKHQKHTKKNPPQCEAWPGNVFFLSWGGRTGQAGSRQGLRAAPRELPPSLQHPPFLPSGYSSPEQAAAGLCQIRCKLAKMA